MPDETPLSNEARQAGFGFAAFLLVLGLIDRLLTTNRLSREGARHVIDHALLNAETHQSDSPIPDVVRGAREALEMAQKVLEAKIDLIQKGPRGSS